MERPFGRVAALLMLWYGEYGEHEGGMLIHFQSIPGLSNMRGIPLLGSTDVPTLIRQDQFVAHILRLPTVRVPKLYVLGLPRLRTGPILGDSVELT